MNQVAHWTPGRWSRTAPGRVGSGVGERRTRADLVHDLVQRLADWAADQEGQPRRPVPRLDSHLALADQLRVVANDLVSAEPPAEVRAAALAAVDEVRQALS